MLLIEWSAYGYDSSRMSTRSYIVAMGKEHIVRDFVNAIHSKIYRWKRQGCNEVARMVGGNKKVVCTVMGNTSKLQAISLHDLELIPISMSPELKLHVLQEAPKAL
jgi:hypothetical protein